MNGTLQSGRVSNMRLGPVAAWLRPRSHQRADVGAYPGLGASDVNEIARQPWQAGHQAVLPVAPVLTRTLRELAYSYVPAQGLAGTLRFDEALPDIDVSEGPLRAIMEHLVEGSLRGNPSVTPYCHVSLVEDSADKVVLSVRDNGTPLPECRIEELRGFLQDAATRHVPDRVHRLFLADNLVQWLGGRIRLMATPNAEGTTVLIEIPRSRTVAAPAHPLVGRHVF